MHLSPDATKEPYSTTSAASTNEELLRLQRRIHELENELSWQKVSSYNRERFRQVMFEHDFNVESLH